MQDIAVRNAMVAFLVAVAQSALPNATAEVAVLNNFTVSLSASDSTGLTISLANTLTEPLAAALSAAVDAAFAIPCTWLTYCLKYSFSRHVCALITPDMFLRHSQTCATASCYTVPGKSQAAPADKQYWATVIHYAVNAAWVILHRGSTVLT